MTLWATSWNARGEQRKVILAVLSELPSSRQVHLGMCFGNEPVTFEMTGACSLDARVHLSGHWIQGSSLQVGASSSNSVGALSSNSDHSDSDDSDGQDVRRAQAPTAAAAPTPKRARAQEEDTGTAMAPNPIIDSTKKKKKKKKKHDASKQ
jgi:hypothetical protein